MDRQMNFAIIAAGTGSRLAEEGISVSKPMVELGGKPLIGRLIDIFSKFNPLSINIIINSEQADTREYLENLKPAVTVNTVIKSTPGSMHSFYELLPLLKGYPCCLTTVDTVFNESVFGDYIREFKKSSVDALMAVTEYIDDEKPLFVKCDENMAITGFNDLKTDEKYVSGGIYCFGEKAYDVSEKCFLSGVIRMRDFQRKLISEGLSVKAYPMGKIIDIDHISDIKKAEDLIKNDAFK